MKLNVITVFATVTAAALVGGAMGGGFGYGAGLLAPDLFSTLIPWETLEPVGTATVLSAAVGILLGGGLGVFGVLVQIVASLINRRRGAASEQA
ncbi:MAG: hypothetical protein WD534_06880 [Phycisphaeraceae bacterium]